MIKAKIPTLFAILILIVGVALGVLLVQNRQIFKLGASPEITPKDVSITNVTETSFSVTWVTEKQTTGFVKWGESPDTLDKVALDTTGTASYAHSATLEDLEASKTYYFEFSSDGQDFDDNGAAWQTQTAPKAINTPTTLLISGRVISSNGQAVPSALVTVKTSGNQVLSTLTSPNGTWLIPLGTVRTANLESFATIDEAGTLVTIEVSSPPTGLATARIYPAAAQPAPDIVIGQNHDFTTLVPGTSGGVPSSQVNVPTQERESGFRVGEVPAETPDEVVTLESIEDGEVISTSTPEFFGEGPAGTTITISVESDPITDDVTVDAKGTWQWSTPVELSDGPHTITLSWRDASGILRNLTRTFIVQASEGTPAFESTPSATPTTTPTTTPTPAGTSTPTPSPTPILTSTPLPEETVEPTLPPTPESGSLTPTLVLLMMGLGSLLFGGLVIFTAFRSD